MYKLRLNKRIVIFSVLSLILALYVNLNLFKATKFLSQSSVLTSQQIYYWLQPKFFAIQANNNILFLAGFFSCLITLLFIKIDYKDPLRNIMPFKQIIFYSLLFSVIVYVTTFIFESLFFPKIKSTNITNLIGKSFLCFLSLIFFVCFWAMLTYGFTLTTNNRVVGCLFPAILQFFEIRINNRFSNIRFDIAQYFPTSLSREVVVRQFPFWIDGTWASTQNAFPFANTSIILDRNHNFINLQWTWIFFMLFIILCVCYIKPIILMIVSQYDSEGAKDEINI